MGDSLVIYRNSLVAVLTEARTHIERIDGALQTLSKHFQFPITAENYQQIQGDPVLLAWSDQVIYRFSKAQDVIGAKLFKAFLLAQGDDIDKPFLDILTTLEKNRILVVDDWFELRDIRNEISHDYDADHAVNILNAIYTYRGKLLAIVNEIQKTL